MKCERLCLAIIFSQCLTACLYSGLRLLRLVAPRNQNKLVTFRSSSRRHSQW